LEAPKLGRRDPITNKNNLLYYSCAGVTTSNLLEPP
jgi:hypothetical protein